MANLSALLAGSTRAHAPVHLDRKRELRPSHAVERPERAGDDLIQSCSPPARMRTFRHHIQTRRCEVEMNSDFNLPGLRAANCRGSRAHAILPRLKCGEPLWGTSRITTTPRVIIITIMQARRVATSFRL